MSSHLFLCLPCFFRLSLCLARWFWPDLMNGRHDHNTAFCVSLQWSGGLRVVRLPAGSWHKTSLLLTWSLYEMLSILRQHLISMACILLWSSAVRVHDSQANRKMDVTRERISRILELREILLSFQTGFNLVNAAVVCAILESMSAYEPSSVITEPRYLNFWSWWLFQTSVHLPWSLCWCGT